ncbi:hypothetical protein LguiB_029577 [Lonicera macranthoides]
MMEENIEIAESIITKWDLNTPSYTKFLSLFHKNRKGAKVFIKSVNNLSRAMHFLVSGSNSGSQKLVLAQNLMQIAMKRLEKEFYLILSANRECLDPESVSNRSSRVLVSYSDDEVSGSGSGSDDEAQRAGEIISDVEKLSVIAMSDLRLIADCMISSGYGKECAKIYKIMRKSIVEESLFRLGIEQYSSSHISKMNSKLFEHNLKNWMNAMKIIVKMLFHGERFLCDHVFSTSEPIRESCFTDIIKEAAMNLFKFPELVAKSKRSPDKIFPLMDLYETISDLFPEIESIFSYVSVSEIKLQNLSSLHKLAESVQAILTDFESSIQKNSSKALTAGGGVHPLTISAMNYMQYLANYSGALGDIFADSPSTEKSISPLPESYFDSPIRAVTVRLSRIILVLLCKIDSKAEQYKDIALSYLFLANNLHFVVETVRKTNLKYILGQEWISEHERKVRQYAVNYESTSWSKVLSCLPENREMSVEMVKECFRQFNSVFDEVYRKQLLWVVVDGKLRDEIKVSIAKQLVPQYKNFYDANLGSLSGERNLRALVRFAPDDLNNYLSDLFHGMDISGSSSFSSSSRGSRCLPSI